MRRTIATLIILCAVAFAQAPSPSAKPIAPENENSRKARALLQQMIQALGGQAYLTFQTMEQEGQTYGFHDGKPTTLGAPFWQFYKFPDKTRVEVTKQRDIVYLYIGDKGYEKTYKGVAAMEPTQLRDYNRRHQHSLDIVLRQWLPDPGTALFYDGAAVAEQKPCDSVTLMNSKNDSVTIYIDSIKHLPVKKVFQWRDPADNLKNTEGQVYDNWRLEQGLMTAHTLLASHNGDTVSEQFLSVVRYNTNMPDAMFDTNVTYDPYKRSGPRQ